jgi:acyl CoA:acetate/3-ketoacid CoA transferase alpha subunit
MAQAAKVTIVEVDEIVEAGELDPDEIITPGIFVDRIVVRDTDFSPFVPINELYDD